MLAAALSDSLWLAGRELGATVALVSEDYCITPHLDYKLDNFTEKVPPTSDADPVGRLEAAKAADRPLSCSCSPSARRRRCRSSSWTTSRVSVEPQTSGTSRRISTVNLTLTCSVSVHSGGKPRRHPLPLQPHLLPHRHQVTGLHYTAPCRLQALLPV